MSEKSLKSRFNKKNVLSGIILSVALSLTVFFFSPIDIFLANQIDFVIGFDLVVLAMSITSLVAIALFTCFFMLCLLIKETFFYIMRNIFFGVLCAMYFQMMFYNGRMQTLTGDSSVYIYMNDKVYYYTNYAIYFVIICVPFIVWSLKEIYPNVKPFSKISKQTTSFICLALIVMQLVGSVSMVFNYGIRKVSKDEYVGVLSYDEAMKLSDNENIVVFLTDRLDSLWLDESIEEYPETKEILDGFTFYQNNVSTYTNTFPAVAELLTGNKYEGQLNSEYLTKAWHSENIMNTFYENDYRINLLLDSLTTYNSYNDIKEFTSTYTTVTSGYKINYLGGRGIVSTITCFSLMKLGPYALKELIADQFGPNFSNDFFEILDKKDYYADTAISGSSDINFYNYLKNHGLNTESDRKTFNFIHLNFAHNVSYELSELGDKFDPKNMGADVSSTIRGGFEILNEYFEQMKELGIYDSSTIIILGDHGHPPYATEAGEDRLDDVIVTALLIKEANAEHAPLKIDKDTELSNSFFCASILDYAGIDHSQYGCSYSDVINENLHMPRTLNVYNFRVSQPELVCKYNITGDARDFNNWEYVKP